MIRRFTQLPALPERIVLEDWQIAVILPLARVNLVPNPSFETGTTGWAALGGSSISRVAAQQWAGAAALQIVASVGSGGYTSLTLTGGVAYAVSARLKGAAGGRLALQIRDVSGNNVLAQTVLASSGRWQRVELFFTPAATTTYLIVAADKLSGSTFWLDAVQVESCADGVLEATTYIDGDQLGLVANEAPPAYGWYGTPHASTSWRSGRTRAGGRMLYWQTLSVLLSAIIGLGMAPPQNVGVSYAVLDGGQDDYTRKAERQFTLMTRLQDADDDALRATRATLAAALDRDASALQQRLRMLIWRTSCGVIDSDTARIDCKYVSGLGGNEAGAPGEDAPLTFLMYAPYIVDDGEQAQALAVQQTVANANGILLRTPGGAWQALGSGVGSGAVFAIAQGNDGRYYIGGSFASFGGVANTRAVAVFDPVAGTVSALGTGAASGVVTALTVAPNGDIWATGTFADMGGVAAADAVARWDGAAWQAVGTPPGAVISTFSTQAAFDLTGAFYYAPGDGTLRRWNGAAWSTVGTAGGGMVISGCLRAPDGAILAFGNFPSVSGVTAQYVARWDGAAWTALTGTIPGVPNAIGYDAYGLLYAGGPATPSNLYAWNGTGWSTLGTIGTALTSLYSLAPASPRGMYVSGTFASAGGVAFPDGFGLWNGSALVGADVDLPGTPTIYAIRAFRDGSVALGYTTSGSATAAATTTITNTAAGDGAGRAYPTLVFTGPSSGSARIYQVVNTTTGRALYFNLTLLAGEQATLILEPGKLKFTSTFRGDVLGTILPGSSEADFFLQPGVNVISAFAADSSVAILLRWRRTYVHLDAL